MKERLFRFKKFCVRHERSAMKVGVDGVLVGAWADVGRPGEDIELLDIGTGCGMMALMAAQRNPAARVTAVEIDSESAAEANENFRDSDWTERLRLIEGDINILSCLHDWEGRFDRVISNPPFFASGLSSPETPREKARHEGSLSPARVIELSARLLVPGGKVALISPADSRETLKATIDNNGLYALKICHVADSMAKAPKRVLIEAQRPLAGAIKPEIEESIIHIKDVDGNFSEDYIALTREFYLGLNQ